ncbi:MAG: barstar family protein [Phycisphaeraceae bacterium]|nr:barstar family protein [Phycisphaerales bacterium]MCB9861293.1 barstar family protein [Phycisphaeraceae bacterium]
MPTVRIDGAKITCRRSFHRVFADALGFPKFYGGNMDAWIDCMRSLHHPGDGMTMIHASNTEPVTLYVDNAEAMPKDLRDELFTCTNIVNAEYAAEGKAAALVVVFSEK